MLLCRLLCETFFDKLSAEVPEIVVQSEPGAQDVSEVDFGTLQKKQKDIRMQIKKNPELNSKLAKLTLNKRCLFTSSLKLLRMLYTYLV